MREHPITRPPSFPASRSVARLVLAALPAVALSSCATTGAPASSRVEVLGDDLQLLRVTDEIWIHVSTSQVERWGLIPTNGLLVLGSTDSLLVDTGSSEDQTRRILEFAEKTLQRPVRQVVITHAHADRMGGIRAIRAPGVVLHAHEDTARVLSRAPLTAHIESFTEKEELAIGGRSIELFYPGPGHARDNIVVWLPWAKVLFAGCIVRSGSSADLGNREQAVLASWPLSLLKLLDRYREAELVVPGHGAPGGVELIHHTLGLLEQNMSPTTGNGHHE